MGARTAIHHRPGNRWAHLAGVARDRASEQSAKAAMASSVSVAEPHLEQQAYLMRLAEIYEARARGGTVL